MRASVVCPVFDTPPALLEAAARSVLAQRGMALAELVLVDDGSQRQETLAALGSLAAADPRVVLRRAERNLGPAGARNLGLQAATGDWVGFVDADDLWPEDKLARAEAVLRAHPEAEWIAGRVAKLDTNGVEQLAEPLSCVPQEGRAADAVVTLAVPALTRSLIADGLQLGASLFRRDRLREAGGFDAKVTYGEDWVLLARLSVTVPMQYENAPGYVLRRQGPSMMWSAGRLSGRFAGGQEAAYADPLLRPFRREIRWALYRTYKDIAMNNLLNGRRRQALWFAGRALALDPREAGEAWRFVSMLVVADPGMLAQRLRRYSGAEQVSLDAQGRPRAVTGADGTGGTLP